MKYGLEKVGKANITLKQKQEEILKIIALTRKDVSGVLPTGYGKSLQREARYRFHPTEIFDEFLTLF